ncbi:hypothetical protein HHK36_033211 [Tetracentron sinense]|uniref:Uncharacterized protein n=1 Tax=Tetracentron sinense TaxID=13715 RepID=A0A835CWC1_TETSI|nr:hypothetical protein HHK36_033211 [Tetracentron sinense]
MSLFSSSDVSVMLFLSLLLSSFMAATASNIYQDFDLIWGDNRATILSSGQLLTHSLDMVSSSSFQSKREYLFRRIYMQLELVTDPPVPSQHTMQLSIPPFLHSIQFT